MTTKQAWIGFWMLSLIWGSSYRFIRIGVEQLSPFQLVFMRTAIATVGLNVLVYGRGKRLPTDWQNGYRCGNDCWKYRYGKFTTPTILQERWKPAT